MIKYISLKLNYFIPYFWPSRLLPQLVVVFLLLLFLGWLGKLLQKCLKVSSRHREILALENIGKLMAQGSGSDPEVSEENFSSNIFSTFVKAKGVSEASPVARHLKAIYFAGRNQGRLEPVPLINHTLHEILSGTHALKGVLSTFIVIGLLGTLVGLADTFSSLNPGVGSQTLGHLNQNVNYMLADLLSNMKSAFAPSILGVFMTVIGVLAYIYVYQHRLCMPLRSDLERLTLTVWIPTLYPTTTEKIKDITRENLKVVKAVAEFAGDAQKNIAEFKEKAGKATTSITALSDAVAQISNAAAMIDSGLTKRLLEFSSNVDRLTSFQVELTSLYKTLVEDSRVFREQVNYKLGEQNTWFPELIKSLKSYEVVHIKGQSELDSDLKKLIAEGTSGFESLSNKNLATIELVRTAIERNLDEINNVLKTNLDQFGVQLDRFGRFGIPIEGAADRMSGTFQNLAKTLENMTGDFRITMTTTLQEQSAKENREVKESFNKLESVIQMLVEALKNNADLIKNESLRESTRKKEKTVNEPIISDVSRNKSTSFSRVTPVNEMGQESGLSMDIKTLITVSERQSRAIEKYFNAQEIRQKESILSLAKRLLKMNIWTL